MRQHRLHGNNETQTFPIGKVVCVGRNYVEHVNELNNAMPDEAVLFIKPSTAVCSLNSAIVLPEGKGGCHYEAELALLIGKPLKNASHNQVEVAVAGIGLALDLTLRDKQSELKAKGLPWERAKAFDNSCPVSDFYPLTQPLDRAFCYQFSINGELRQSADSSHMIWGMIDLVTEISHQFTLEPGDVVITGTPKGVGQLHKGDKLSLSLESYFQLNTQVSV
ncbi:fumarylacetoacetate hydrolase family protein [Aestuariibacter sp. AA17]|uniref:Fumarylacetoacetate hydrolase family protein n=1 Tax=Fluctibacter corallii TaxID=2984329 RepID=A0ABT3A8U7_9ALTE|nr:fumarylacetoacetate hydrolase family protein [Aestuariibacter sp. AA17]MCV2885102.1 fumarylacetoacetate hydrolase family protein [Aestuariibacter sp. AA17]